MFKRILLITLCSIFLTGCEQIALMTTPKKKARISHSQLAKQAEAKFWETLHRGQYAEIPETTQLLNAAYLENPYDPKLAAHLGFLHIWQITERERLTKIPPTIIDQIILSRRYFKDAVTLNPSDARFQGFLADSMLAEGDIMHDEREQVRGYFQLKRAISMWPEFNYFTGGYVMSTRAANSSEFKEALEWQWKTMDLCAGTKIDRNNPDFRPYLSQETQTGAKRACWNSWIAPHNFEGFFMNMGDMLVKAGDKKTAIKIYKNAQLSKTYNSWPYRSKLEQRIAEATNTTEATPNRPIMFNSGYGCVVCHQAS